MLSYLLVDDYDISPCYDEDIIVEAISQCIMRVTFDAMDIMGAHNCRY